MSYISNENIGVNEIERTKKEFIRVISHNFNTKLTSIYSAAEIAIDSYNGFLHNSDQDFLTEIFYCLRIIRDGSKELANTIEQYISENIIINDNK